MHSLMKEVDVNVSNGMFSSSMHADTGKSVGWSAVHWESPGDGMKCQPRVAINLWTLGRGSTDISRRAKG